MALAKTNPERSDDEQHLIEAAQLDPAKFGVLFERHARRVYAFVASRVHNRHEAEDVTSEVFHQALKNLKHYEYRGIPFSAWLFRIAANTLAQRGRELAREQGIATKGEPVIDPDAERRVLLFELVNTLPEDQQRVIALRYAEQKSLRDIADVLQRSEPAVKQLHYRAIENLRKQMEGRK